MKNGIIHGAILLVLAGLASPQSTLDNPAMPQNPKAGRVVALTEEMRIVDTGEDFYIKNVYGLGVGPDGSVFVQDEQKQLLQFDPNGRFIRNLMKTGQGPGELTGIINILVVSDRILVYGNPPKVLSYDFDGNLMDEAVIPSGLGFGNLISFDSRIFTFHGSGRPELKGGTAWADIPQQIIAVAEDGRERRILGSFPIQAYATVREDGGQSQTRFNHLIIVSLDGKRFVLSHTPEYLVKIFDAESETVICQFNRKYKRTLRPSQPSGGVIGPGGTGPKPPKYMNDIRSLHCLEDRILVQTSAVDKLRGPLFDEFDLDGRYIDCFFIKFFDREMITGISERKLVFSGDHVYFVDRTDDALVVIRKCRLSGSP